MALKNTIKTENRISQKKKSLAYYYENKEQILLRDAIYKANNKEKLNKGRALWKLKNPEKVKAHLALHKAIRQRTIIKQPCIECGEEKTQGHHEDYNKPLDVIWLCHNCHMKIHADKRNMAGGHP